MLYLLELEMETAIYILFANFIFILFYFILLLKNIPIPAFAS